MSSVILINRMPNVFVNMVQVTESNDKTTIEANVYLLDDLNIRQRDWSHQKTLSKIKINTCLVEGVSDIKKVNDKVITLQDKDTKSVMASALYQKASMENI